MRDVRLSSCYKGRVALCFRLGEGQSTAVGSSIYWKIVAVDIDFSAWYNVFDNLIPIPWRLWCIAAAAEQDNRV